MWVEQYIKKEHSEAWAKEILADIDRRYVFVLKNKIIYWF